MKNKLNKSEIELFIKSARRGNRSCASMETSKWTGTQIKKEGSREINALRSLVKRGFAVILSSDHSTIPQWKGSSTHVHEYSWRLNPTGLDQMQKIIRKK